MRKIFFLLSLLALYFPVTARAQTAVELIVSPPIQTLEMDQSQQANFSVSFKNNSSLPITVRITANQFVSDNQSGIPKVDWKRTTPLVHLNSDTLVMGKAFPFPAGAKQQFFFTATPTRADKDFYAVVLFETADQDSSTTGSGAQIQSRIGSTILVRANNSLVQKGNIHTTLSLPKIIDMFDTAPINLALQNDMNTLLQVRGVVTLKDRGGNPLETFAIFPDVVLAQSSRNLRGTKEFAVGPLFPGVYSIESMVVGPTNTDKVTETLYVLPLRIVGLVLALLLILVLAQKLRRKK
ncbi:MAG TPA: hypothetical protein VLH19_04185 [Patescibacteria group bacterium]|nr:hypothetical protein [Patescibacteria group bacterium]